MERDRDSLPDAGKAPGEAFGDSVPASGGPAAGGPAEASPSRPWAALFWVFLYALAMAYVEAAVVVYLRRLFGVGGGYASAPAFDSAIAAIEGGREAATLLMLFAVGWLAGQRRRAKLAFAFYAFGLWDILYYAWLRLLVGWPSGLLDTDLLFLLPAPWWGPILAPVLVSILFVVAGTLVVLDEARRQADLPRPRPVPPAKPVDRLALVIGMLTIFYAFAGEGLGRAKGGGSGMPSPPAFDWPLFLAGYGLSIFALAKLLFRGKGKEGESR